MSLFVWEPKYDLGVEAMNDEHKHLVLIMNYLYSQNQRGETKQEMLRTLKALGAYTEKHFQDEEAYMESVGFGGLESHKLIHLQLLKNLCKNARGWIASSETRVPDALFRFLKNWLVAHICKIDMKYSDHATQHHGAMAA